MDEVQALKAAVRDLMKAIDTVSTETAIIQPFLGVIIKHSETIRKASV